VYGVGNATRRLRVNHLNSVLIEGVMQEGSLACTGKGKDAGCVFNLLSKGREEITAGIRAGGSVAEACRKHAAKKLRIVGQLGNDGHGGLVVVAEHMEASPV
jgi:hypothetical protein